MSLPLPPKTSTRYGPAMAGFISYLQPTALEAQRIAIARHLGDDHQLFAEFIETGDDRAELAKAIAECRDRGATLLVAGDTLTLDGTVGVPVVTIDPRTPSQRTKEALQAAKARGVKLGGYRGHQADWTAQAKFGGAAKAKIADQRANDLRDAIERARGDGATTPTAIAAYLNREGIPTTNGGQWQTVQVQRLLKRLEARS